MSRQRDAELDRLRSARESARQRQQAAWQAQQAAWERRSSARAAMNRAYEVKPGRLRGSAGSLGSLRVYQADQRPANRQLECSARAGVSEHEVGFRVGFVGSRYARRR